MRTRPLALLEQQILVVLRATPEGLNYAPLRQKIICMTGQKSLAASRVIDHLQRLERLGFLLSRTEALAPGAPLGARPKRIYKIRPRLEPPPPPEAA